MMDCVHPLPQALGDGMLRAAVAVDDFIEQVNL